MMGEVGGGKSRVNIMKNIMSLKGKTEKSLSFALTVLIFFISELDPFVQHVNTKLKEKEIQAVATNPKTTHQLKVSVIPSSQSQMGRSGDLGF